MMLVRMATPGMVRADAFDQLQKDVAVGAALHALEDRGARVLQRHIDVLDQVAMLRDGVEQSLRDLIGIAIEETNPFFVVRLDLRQAGEQQRETVLHPEILAVAGGVLADQVDLAHALRKQARGFRRSPIRSGGCGIFRDTAG